MPERKQHDPYFRLTMLFLVLGMILAGAMAWKAATYKGFDDVKVVGLQSEVGMWGGR